MPIIPCPNVDVLCWFLERTDASLVYASVFVSETSFPVELREAAAVAQKDVALDLAVVSPDDLTQVTGAPRRAGETAVFVGTRLVCVLPSMLENAPARMLGLVAAKDPDYEPTRRMARSAILMLLIKGALDHGVNPGPGASSHGWDDSEMEQTIDLHLRYRTDSPGRREAIERLARRLAVSVGQVTMAVDAVGALDPEDPRRWPRPSKRLEQLWVKRGLPVKQL